MGVTAFELNDKRKDTTNNEDIPISVFVDLHKAFGAINCTFLAKELTYYGVQDNAKPEP